MTEIPLMPLWVTLFLTIWAPVGPLIGIMIGHFLSRSQQRSRWIADNEVKEWQELLTTLTTSFQTVVGTNPRLPPVPGEEIERLKEAAHARLVAHEVLVNRIFIFAEVRKQHLFERWIKGMEEFDKDHDEIKLSKMFGELSGSILLEAHVHIGKLH